jgi:antirestriction protein ArdC
MAKDLIIPSKTACRRLSSATWPRCRIIAKMSNAPAIKSAGSKAFYSSITNCIYYKLHNDAAAEPVHSAKEYGATLLYELARSTGHAKRLARESVTEATAFGSAVYSKEELIADMGAAYLCAEADHERSHRESSGLCCRLAGQMASSSFAHTDV